MNDTPTIKEISHRNLLQTKQLSEDIESHDALLLTNRGKLSAVIVDAEKVDELGNLAPIVEERLRQDDRVVLTEKDIAILSAINDLGSARLADIAERIDRQSSNIHRPLQSLVDVDLVNRTEGEEILYSLTSQGVEFIQEGK